MMMFVTAKELEGIPGLPATIKGIREALSKRAGSSVELMRKRPGTKAFEYHIDIVPEPARTELMGRMTRSLLEQKGDAPAKAVTKAGVPSKLELLRQCPALLEHKTGELTEKQRQIADARSALVAEVFKLEESAGLSRIKAITAISEMSRMETLPAHLKAIVETANARKGTRKGISSRTLNGWVVDYLRASDAAERLVLLAPGHHKARPLDSINWLPLFLKHWRSLKGPSLKLAYSLFTDEWKTTYGDQPAMLNVLPSIYAIRRALNKLSLRERLRGRVSGSAARSLEIYQRRDWSQMPVNGC